MADSELLHSFTRAMVAAGLDHGVPWLLVAPQTPERPVTASSHVGSVLAGALVDAGFVVLALPDLTTVDGVDAEVEIDEFGARVRLADAEIGLVGAVPARALPEDWTQTARTRGTAVVMIAFGLDLAVVAGSAASPGVPAGSIDLVAACEAGDVLAGAVTPVGVGA